MNIHLTPFIFAALCSSTGFVDAQKANCNLGAGLDFNLKVFVERVQPVQDYTFRSSDCSAVEGELLIGCFVVKLATSINLSQRIVTQSISGSLGNELQPLPATWQGTVTRRLLKFSTGVHNAGPDNLPIDRKDCSEQFIWGDCHKHYHFNNFTWYELQHLNGTAVVTGRKQAFCLMDIRRMGGSGSSQYSCSNQGISAGWADIYSYSLDGQWIDVTGVPDGSYQLSVTIDYGNVFAENNETDNTVIKPVTISGSGESGACNPTGLVCNSNNDCCSGLCVTGQCYCNGNRAPCGGNQECCSGVCNRNKCKGN